MATIDHWIGRASVDYVFFGEPEAFFDQVLVVGDPQSVPGVLSPATYVPLAGVDLYDEEKNTAAYARWVKVTDIGALPRPAWHLLDLSRYATSGQSERRRRLRAGQSRVSARLLDVPVHAGRGIALAQERG